MEAALKENIHFMWISGMNTPDHNTINRFRSERLKGVLKQVFGKVVELLVAEGLVNLKEVYIDGTKIESKANRYTFVWGKAIKTSKKRIKKQLEELWDYTQNIAQEELQDTTPTTFEQIDAQKVADTISKINEALKDKPISKKVSQKLKYAAKNWPDALDRYDDQEKVLNGRNSYSKTDPDATFMRMKDDYMCNGQLKPGFNWQISTQDQFILNYSIHQNPTDTKTLPSHPEGFSTLYGQMPNTVTADAGYGSELSGLSTARDVPRKTGNRIITVNHQLRLLKAKARALLLSEEGIKHQKKRPWDVEPVFGNIKYNKGFKRFMLCGCDKVEIEAGLLIIAHNLKKWSC
jgi:IS5 family transposase